MRGYIGLMNTTPEIAAKRAIELLGGARQIAKELDVTTQAVYQWKRIPAEHVLKIEGMLSRVGVWADDKISRHELRPDIFGEGA